MNTSVDHYLKRYELWKVRFSYRVRYCLGAFFHFFLQRTRAELRGKHQHSTLISNATYSPWKIDSQFKKVLKQIAPHSLLDEMRLYEIWQLASQVKHLPGHAIEIGCWRGGAGCLIAHRILQSDKEVTVYLCDTFRGVVKAGCHDEFYQGQEFANSSTGIVDDLVKRMGLENTVILSGIFPEETGTHIVKQQFKFAHIDVDVYQSAKDAFEWLLPKLVNGAVVIFDDYGSASTQGIRLYIDELHGRADLIIVRNLNGQAVVIKR